jgi:hypothetical protein
MRFFINKERILWNIKSFVLRIVLTITRFGWVCSLRKGSKNLRTMRILSKRQEQKVAKQHKALKLAA